VGGTLALLAAARDAGVRRVVQASSSAVYGDLQRVPHREDRTGAPLSPYALTKLQAEEWGDLFGRVYGLEVVGLRYFNVFGPRQHPRGAYAAVIPAWTRALLRGEPCVVHGDGSTTRDLVPVADVVQANLLAAVTELPSGARVFNVGTGRSTSLGELFRLLRDVAGALHPCARFALPLYDAQRQGDVHDSRADISSITAVLGYRPSTDLGPAIARTVRWHTQELRIRATGAATG
ncbi:MAG TPA: NAD-dependent epimerase/dehydratase family protein, partial [Longimicrobium sp.]|nr:NAD-dependent epimerase/dehydratase family protein [Longimicrobium sp.]